MKFYRETLKSNGKEDKEKKHEMIKKYQILVDQIQIVSIFSLKNQKIYFI